MNDLKYIWEEHLQVKDRYLKTKLNETGIFSVYAATNQITGKRLFVIDLSNQTNDLLLKKATFKGLVIQILDFGDHKELTILLLDNSLEDIFISFIENILDEILPCVDEVEALDKISGVIARWKKLFDKAAGSGMTPEQQKGLFGELLLFNELLLEGYAHYEILSAWAGPTRGDKDFIFGSVGIEVKLTTSKYPAIKITNERQLENLTLNRLYLFLYIVEEVRKNGVSLTDLVVEIRTKLNDNLETLRIFNERILLAGFLSDDEEYYTQQYFLKAFHKFEVNDNFPRLISSDLQPGIYNVSYSIELSACGEQKITSDTITELINGY